MGDRGNIAVLQRDGDQVWLYSHWGGYSLPELLQKGLKNGNGRWNDDSYLTKIIFGQACDSWNDETGHGISCRMQDNEHPILVVDIPGKRVFTIEEGKLVKFKIPDGYIPDKSYSFEEYCSLTTEQLKQLN